MKIGKSSNGTIEVAISDTEYGLIGRSRISCKINPNSEDEWIKVFADDKEGKLPSKRSDRGFPWRVGTKQEARQLSGARPFGFEELKSKVRDGVLYGSKPKMNKPLIARHTSGIPRRLSTPAPPPIMGPADPNGPLGEAVKLVNNFKRSYPNEIELAIGKNGFLVIRLMFELGITDEN